MICGKLAGIALFGLLWVFSLLVCLIFAVLEFVVQFIWALILLPTGDNPLQAFESNPPPLRYALVKILRGKRFRLTWETSSDPFDPDPGVISYSEWVNRSRGCENSAL